MKNIIVLGGSYGGARAAQVLARGLRTNHRIILIDRNSHANHLYVIPRLGVLPGHEHKAFIPYHNLFASNSEPGPSRLHPWHLTLHASAVKLNPHSVTLDRAFPEYGLPSATIPFEYLVYALGSHLPAPIDLWYEDDVSQAENIVQDSPKTKKYGGTKTEGISWLKRCQERVGKAEHILVVGGGALGVQFATDIATVHPSKGVTLLHSRHRLLPRFDYGMHIEILKTLEDQRVSVILGERLDLSSIFHSSKFADDGQRVVRTEKGREIACDLLLLCTGQIPNTGLLREMSPESVDPSTGLAHILPTMQLGILSSMQVEPASDASSLMTGDSDPGEDAHQFAEIAMYEEDEFAGDEEEETTPYPNIFVIGDAADAFGAIKAGHCAYYQGEIAANNILKLIDRDTECPEETVEIELDHYVPGPPAIKVSLGVGERSVYEINGVIGRKEAPDPDDLDAPLTWQFFGMKDVKEEDMFL